MIKSVVGSIMMTSIVLATATFASPKRPTLPKVLVAVPPFSEEKPKFLGFSGERLIGFSSVDLDERTAGQLITVSGVNSSDKRICVDIVQSNGGYKARFSVPNPKVGPSFVFVLPNQTIKNLKVRTLEIAIRARASANNTCLDDDPLLPAAWGERSVAALAFYINAQRSTKVTVGLPDRSVANCTDLATVTGNRRVSATSYTHVCRVNPATQCSVDSQMQIRTRVGNDVGAPVIANVRGPCTS